MEIESDLCFNVAPYGQICFKNDNSNTKNTFNDVEMTSFLVYRALFLNVNNLKSKGDCSFMYYYASFVFQSC